MFRCNTSTAKRHQAIRRPSSLSNVSKVTQASLLSLHKFPLIRFHLKHLGTFVSKYKHVLTCVPTTVMLCVQPKCLYSGVELVVIQFFPTVWVALYSGA